MSRMAAHFLLAGALAVCAPAAAQTSPEAVLRQVDSEADIHVSARVETLDGEVLVDFDGATPRVLASNTKLLTTAAALRALEPDRRWTTRCLLQGDALWIVGDGDPSLRLTADGDYAEDFLDTLAEALRAAAHDALAEVVLDARAFPGPSRPPGWPENQWSQEYCAPVAALQVEGSRLRVSIRDGRARVHPPLGRHLEIDRGEPDGRVFATWWGRADALLVVRGRASGGEPAAVAVYDPLWLYAAWLQEGLARRGIPVGAVRIAAEGDAVPEVEPLLEHASAWTLAEAIAVVNKDSDNQLAETLLCTLGLAQSGVGSREAGLQAVREVLEEADLDLSGMVQADGSGMSRGSAPEHQNRASPALLCGLLRRVAEQPQGRVLFQSLPVGGEEGRLEARFRDAAFRAGRVRAKTGFITGASSLSGYLLAGDDTILVFSIVVNYRPDGKARTNNRRFKRMQEDFLAALLQEQGWR